MNEMNGYEREIEEVRCWKAKVSKQIESLGFSEFHKRASKETAGLQAQIEAARQAKLSSKSPRAA